MIGPAVVLVEPREEGNVGAVARVMANFGLSRLILAGSTDLPGPRDFVAACADGRPVLERAARAPDLAAALAPFAATVAVTRREGKHRSGHLAPARLAGFLDSLPEGRRAALVFGRETDGLRAEEVLQCGHLVAIPSVPEAPSLNVAQAVAVVAYALAAARCAPVAGSAAAARGPAITPGVAAEPPATRAELEDLFTALDSALAAIGFLEGDRAGDTMASLRRLLGRALPTEREVRMLRGLARKIAPPAQKEK